MNYPLLSVIICLIGYGRFLSVHKNIIYNILYYILYLYERREKNTCIL